MGIFELIWDMNQESRIRQTEQSVEQSARRVAQTHDRHDELASSIERLTLVTQAMWELLRDRTELTELQLTDKVQEVDMRDGRVDGKRGLQATSCPSCKRRNGKERLKCLYCAAPLDPALGAFDKV